MTYTCSGCGVVKETDPALKDNRQKRAVTVCAPCVRASMTPDELRRLLSPER